MGHGRENKPNIQGIKVSNQDSRKGGRERGKRHISRYHLTILLMPQINEDIQNVHSGIVWLYLRTHRYRIGRHCFLPHNTNLPLNNRESRGLSFRVTTIQRIKP